MYIYIYIHMYVCMCVCIYVTNKIKNKMLLPISIKQDFAVSVTFSQSLVQQPSHILKANIIKRNKYINASYHIYCVQK